MRALAGMFLVAALAGSAAACPPSEPLPPPTQLGWAPVPVVRPPPAPPRGGTSLLVFGVVASTALSLLVLVEKARLRRLHAETTIDPLPAARLVRR